MRQILIPSLLALSLLMACSPDKVMAKFIPQQEDQAARDYISQIQHHKFDFIEANMDPSLKSPSLESVLSQMSAQFPDESVKSSKIVGANTITVNDTKQVNLTYEFEYASKWLLINIITKSEKGQTSIIGLHLTPMSNSLENTNRFTLQHKKPQHYILFTIAIALLIFWLITLIVCVRTKSLHKRWLWIIGILVNVGAINLDWTTGAMSFNIIHFQILSASMTSAPYGPWVLSVSMPILSILFWAKRSKFNDTNSNTNNSESSRSS